MERRRPTAWFDSAGHLVSGDRPDLGVFAASDIAEGDVLVRLPRSLWINDQHTANDVEPYDGASSSIVLAAWVLRERAKGAASFWAPYVRVLPRHVQLPHLWGSALLAEVHYRPMIKKIEERRREYDDEYARCDRAAIANASREDFGWAVAAVSSRAFMLNLRLAGSGDATTLHFLLPFIDFLNHDLEPQAAVREDAEMEVSEDEVVLVATRAVPGGAPVHGSYGDKSSDRFFIGYGFVPAACTPYDWHVMFADVRAAVARAGKAHAGVDGWRAGYQAALRAARKVVALVEEHLLGYPFNAHDWPPYDASQGLMVWPGAVAEPRLLATLAAAAWSYERGQDASLPMAGLSHVAITAARLFFSYREDVASSEADAGTAAINQALRWAVAVARAELEQTAGKWPTTYEADVELLEQLDAGACAGDGVGGSRGACAGWSPDWELALRYRVCRKRTLWTMLKRIEEAWPT
eukprot:SM000133S26836  [mRNA]  locus=s133:355263:358278:- [translate_table: standard]